jgi:MerR family transcriptional regulator, light-induced transcriptional regulator
VLNLYNSGLTVREVSDRLGVGVPTLRAWERRYGFPVPNRLPSGHRRYTEEQVRALDEVLRLRQAGVRLDAAMAAAIARARAPMTSIVAALKGAMPDVSPVVLSERAMLAVSRAVEDEVATRAERPLLVGAFQEERFWRRSEPRWRDLAGTALIAIAFGASPEAGRPRSLRALPVPTGTALTREWAIVCDDSAFTACLVGVERPGRARKGARRFEALWTVEPAVVRTASGAGCAIAADIEPEIGALVADRLRIPPVATTNTIRAATALSNRIIHYLDGIQRGPARATAPVGPSRRRPSSGTITSTSR